MGDDDDCIARHSWDLVLPYVVDFEVVDNAFPIKKVSNIVKHFIKRAHHVWISMHIFCTSPDNSKAQEIIEF